MPPSALPFVDVDIGNVNRAREAGYEAMLFVDETTFRIEAERLMA